MNLKAFTATTYTKGNNPKEGDICIASNDEVPLVLGEEGKGATAIVISKEDAISFASVKAIKTAIKGYDVSKTEAYIAPCLTFSHTPATRELLLELMDKGYGACCKRTSGVDYLDVPVLVLLQLRKFGIPFENIHITDYDTFENPEMLFSASRGDKEKNVTVVSVAC